MSLIGALNIGKSAMAVSQAAIQTTGNNIANAGNADYTRQVARITPNKDQQLRPGIFIGNGINLSAIERQIDEALQTRLRGSFGDEASADTMMQWMGRIESVFNELSDEDLSTQFSTFFSAWSNLANKPQDVGLRQIVLQSGASLANWFNNLRSQLVSLTADADARLRVLTNEANDLAGQIARINGEIVRAEGGQAGQANGLRDQRDALLKRLSTLMDVKTIQRANGSLDVLIGSEPLVIGTDSRGLELKLESIQGELHSKVVFSADKGAVRMNSGSLGALDQVRKTIDNVVEQVDKLAGELIFELNKLHSSGQGLVGMQSVTSTNIVEDPTVALNAPASGLKFVPTNGSFVVHVKDRQTGLITSTLVRVDLNRTGTDTTLNTLAADLNAIDNITASIVGGRLDIVAGSRDVEISFSQDSSGVLSALGINGFFTGTSARDIAVSQRLREDPSLLAAAMNGQPGDNQTARAIAALETKALTGLQGRSLRGAYEALINRVATDVSSARSSHEAARVVRETLEGQREALSGVSLDEEAVNLLRHQRAFQGAARLIAAVDELMKTVLTLV